MNLGWLFSRPTCRIHDREAKYYANGEDAYEMRKYFKDPKTKKGDKKKGDAAAAEPTSAASAEQQPQAATA